ncbi:MAG: Nicotinate-nucleotide adenylyltransferase [Syntrophorhabdaceae bacterium PtaU1.Bin034]|jgi:nicotinate-nucleotide adenylyltransferase|nr:MAG: Nicotinate-nucleotide adenylyltransferase [Syntrophorhabdaceae bacterium PtaU1.Bin034]
MGVGLFGGTFDPVHMGHLRIAEEVRERFSLEKIYFIPARVQPLKQQVRTAGADDRVRMIEMAIRNNRFFRTSTVEIKRGGISYSIDTVKLFSRRFDDIYFLVGMDAFADIGLWKGYRELFFYAHFIVMMRPGGKVEGLPGSLKGEAQPVDDSTWEHVSGKRIYFHAITQLDISSTTIRELSKNGKSIKYLVPYSVERYIMKRGLYIN